MLGVLRDAGDEAASLAPQPGIADIAAAVAQSSATGVATELVVEGHQRPLAPGIELAAFRIVQEALTNVRKHAGRSASATVRISYETARRSSSRSPTTGVARPPRCPASGRATA